MYLGMCGGDLGFWDLVNTLNPKIWGGDPAALYGCKWGAGKGSIGILSTWYGFYAKNGE